MEEAEENVVEEEVTEGEENAVEEEVTELVEMKEDLKLMKELPMMMMK